jgi:hypothetical protein
LPERFEGKMSTVSPPERHPVALSAARDPVLARPTTPLFTRHMLGAIEADRDDRRLATRLRRLDVRTPVAHPRLAAAVAAEAERTSQTRVHLSRWINEGGRFDPDGAARLRIGDKEMKRCNS